MTQIATTAGLADAQRTIIAVTRYTEQHNTPSYQLIEHMKLKQGEKQLDVPKIGNMTMSDLVDGQDMVDSEEIGMSTVSLTVSETGMKVIVTDQLVAQSQPAIFTMIGRQMGEGNARKKDTDVQALYTNLNGGTSLGAAAKSMSVANFAGAIATGKGRAANPCNPTYAVHHPWCVYDFVSSATAIGSSNYWPESMQKDKLQKFYSNKTFNGVMLFESGLITIDSSDDAIGCLAEKGAMVALESVSQKVERQRDASLRGTEVVMTARYGVFELDDTRGYPLTFDATTPATDA